MIKNLQAKNMHLVSENQNFKLIRLSEEGKSNLKPLVFINGQMDHRIQAVETFTNITKPWCYQYSGYYQYDDNLHTPYIFLYDYPIHGIDRSKIDLNAFASGLIKSFEELKLSDIDIMSQSCGGMIATLASKNERVDRVVAMHSPIYGSPLLQSEKYKKYLKNMTLAEKTLFALIGILVDENFGFMQNNKYGFSNIEQVGDLSKIIFTTSNISNKSSKNMLGNFIAEIIYKYLGVHSDGVVTYDKERMDSDGLTYVDENNISHFEMGNHNYNNTYYTRYLRK